MMKEPVFDMNTTEKRNMHTDNAHQLLRMICTISSNAYIYMNFRELEITTAGNWEYFFDFPLREGKDFLHLFECVEEVSILPLREVLYLEQKGSKKASIECYHVKNSLWMECETTVIYDSSNNPVEKIICFRNITKYKMQKEELEYLAYYDSLTGLYNRNYFVRILSEWLRQAESKNQMVGVMFVDIDDFRKINEGLGMLVGDELIQTFGSFLRELQGKEVMISRFCRDLFCIAVYAPSGIHSMEHLIRTIQKRNQEPYGLLGKKEIRITTGIGVAMFPEAANSALELINCAEIVMFRAKTKGKDMVQYYNEPILKAFFENVSLEHRLKEAIGNENFSLCFQPQYMSQDEKLRGVEALIRWEDGDGRAISPALFIPLAEKCGSIISIGDWVLRESIRIFAEWKKKFHYSMILSINISSVQYKAKDFVKKLTDLLQVNQVATQEIELEITESVLIDDFSDVIGKMMQLRKLGVRVSLDDFGTGYSSLSYLKGLPIDTLKIDKSFVDSITTDASTQIIMESIVSMVKKLGFETVAEGVETEEQYEYLKKINCDNIQGFLLGKPMRAQEIEHLLATVC